MDFHVLSESDVQVDSSVQLQGVKKRQTGFGQAQSAKFSTEVNECTPRSGPIKVHDTALPVRHCSRAFPAALSRSDIRIALPTNA